MNFLRYYLRDCWIGYLEAWYWEVRAEHCFKSDTEVEFVIYKAVVVTPTFPEVEIQAIFEAALESELGPVAVTESIESLKSVISSSVKEVTKKVSIKSLSEPAGSQSMNPDKGEVIDRYSTEGGPRVKTMEGELIDYGSTAGGPH